MTETIALSMVVLTVFVMALSFIRELIRHREFARIAELEPEFEPDSFGPVGWTLPPDFEHTEDQGMCPMCNARDPSCQICEGKGYILYRDDSYEEPVIHLSDGDDCPSCDGEGFHPSIREDRTLDPCELCHGTGIIDSAAILESLGISL